MNNVTAAQRLRWLCGELMGGNQFSREQLEKWFIEADAEVHTQNCKEDGIARKWTPEGARRRVGGTFGT